MSSRKEKYALEPKPLGRGGQAEVYPARDKRNGNMVALKRLIDKNEESVARMKREIEVQSSLIHPNVMPILDYSDHYYWYTMPIASRVLGQMQPPIDENILFVIVNDCAQGLLASHSIGCIHRDLTPNNIFLLSDNQGERWVVSDWGLVRQHGKTTVVRTLPSQEFGTAGFAAPELWTDAHNADCRADVYSLGRVVAWCLTCQWPVPNIPLIPDGVWRKFVEITTNLQPDKRIQDMNGVIEYVEKMRKADRKFNIDLKETIEISGLNIQDSMVFRTICEISIEKGSNWIGLEEIQKILIDGYLEESEFLDSIELLAEEYFIQGEKTLDGKIHFFQITPAGFERYARIYLPEFKLLLEKVLAHIVQQNLSDSKALSSALGESQMLVDYALEVLEASNLLATTKTIDGTIYIDEVTVKGRRAARNM